MNCSHCRKPIARTESYERLDVGARLSDGTAIRSEVNLHDACSGPWWIAHHPACVSKPYVRAA